MKVWLLKIGEILPIRAETRRLRTAMLSDELVRRGHEVVWWTSSFDHFHKEWICEDAHQFDIAPGYRIRTIRGCGYQKNVSLRRFVDHRIVSRKFERLIRSEPPPDAIVAAMPTYDMAFVAARYAYEHRIPFILDIRDQWPDVFLDGFRPRFRSLLRGVLCTEYRKLGKAVSMADSLVGISDDLLDWGLELGKRTKGRMDRVFHLGYRRVNVKEKDIDPGIAYLKADLAGKFVVLFVGTFATYHDPSVLLTCAREMAKEDVVFILVGDGALAAELRFKSQGLSNVHFPGWMDARQISSILKIANVGVCPTSIRDTKFFFPNKAFMFWSQGLPILTSFHGEIERVVRGRNVGFVCESAEEYCRSIRSLKQDGTLYQTMCRNAALLFNEQYDADAIYRSYADHVEEQVRGYGPTNKGECHG